MKITEVALDRLRLPLDPPRHAAWDPAPRRWFDATIVRVHTDEGVTGIGSGDTMAGFDAVRHLFVGQDPLDIARHVRAIETANFTAAGSGRWRRRSGTSSARSSGCRWRRCSAARPARVPAYASSAEIRTPAERVEVTRQARAAGFRAVKIRIDGDRGDTGLATVAAVREALGPDFGIMVDLNQSWRMAGDVAPATDLAATRRLVRQLAELDPIWVEEPLPYDDVDGLRLLRAENPGSDRGRRDAVLGAAAAGLPGAGRAGRLPDGRGAGGRDAPGADARRAGRAQAPRSPRTAGPTASGCWPTCTSARGSAGELALPQRPGLGVVLDEDAVDRWRI